MDGYDSQAAVFKALMHPVRLAILDAFRDGEQCVCHLENALNLRQADLSQQIAVIKDVGVVQVRRDGWNIFHYISRPEIFTVIETARPISGAGPGNQSRSRARANHCSCPKCQSKA